jgi:uncharacterized protein YaaW (UPF0174 family)
MNDLQQILARLEQADYEFISHLLDTFWSFNSDKRRKRVLEDFVAKPDETNRKALIAIIEEHIRYLGSADIAYMTRRLGGKSGSVDFHVIVRDVAKRLKVKLNYGPLDEKLEMIVESVASKKLAKLTPKELAEVLRKVGASPESISEFLKKHVPTVGTALLLTILSSFGREIFEKVVFEIVLNLVGRYLGKQLAKKLLAEVAKRNPAWAEWAGPIGWVVAAGWLAIDLQGPASRKTIPSVLYIGVAMMRLKQLPGRGMTTQS